jgi:hypothetical protein
MGLPKMQAHLNIFPESKIIFISLFDQKCDKYNNTIMLQYSPDIKDIEFQLLVHGYKILKKHASSVDNCFEVFILKSI